MAQLTLRREPFAAPVSEVKPAIMHGEEESTAQSSELIMRAAEDKSALEQLYKMYKSDVFAFSFSLYNNRTIAEDCVQETFIRLPHAAQRFKSGGSATAFILGIAKNVSRELYRSEMRFHAGAAKIETDTPLDYAPQTGVLETVRTLPKKYRAVLMLRIYSEMPFKDIAKLMRLPESTVKSRYGRAIGMVSAKLKERTENDET
jgi:RNA polymerase sigma factor (sigma-70 family)